MFITVLLYMYSETTYSRFMFSNLQFPVQHTDVFFMRSTLVHLEFIVIRLFDVALF